MARQFMAMDSVSTFDEIYRKQLWGDSGSNALSGEGSSAYWADSAVADIHRILEGQTGLTICDVGCGDFEFGQRIAAKFSRYYAVDVSKFIIDLNRQKYRHLTNVEFIHRSSADDEIPKADVYLVRQVLQHTTNDHILATVTQILNNTPKLAIVFEDVPITNFVPNKDLATDGPFTRYGLGSGVDLRTPPFTFPFQEFSEVPHPDNIGTKLVCYVYRAPIEGQAV